MNTLRTTALLVSLLTASLISSFSAAQYDTEQRQQTEDTGKHKPYFLPSRDAPNNLAFDRRDSIYHNRGTKGVFNRHVMLRVGGVISQGGSNSWIGTDSHTFVIDPLDSAPHYPGHLIAERAGIRTKYRIAYEDLVPIAIFVESGGTSMYTLFDFDISEDPDFQVTAGFTNHKRTGQVALEFARTRFADALLFIDICEICLGDRNPNLAARLEQEMSDANLNSTVMASENSGYINTDLGLPYTWTTSGNQAQVLGQLARINWIIGPDGNLSIESVFSILAPEELDFKHEDGSSRLTLYDVLYFQEFLDISTQDELEQTEKYIQKMVSDVYFLFRTVALLRTSRETNRSAWDEFFESLISDSMVRANAKPWNLYAESMCSVFPKKRMCNGIN